MKSRQSVLFLGFEDFNKEKYLNCDWEEIIGTMFLNRLLSEIKSESQNKSSLTKIIYQTIKILPYDKKRRNRKR